MELYDDMQRNVFKHYKSQHENFQVLKSAMLAVTQKTNVHSREEENIMEKARRNEYLHCTVLQSSLHV